MGSRNFKLGIHGKVEEAFDCDIRSINEKNFLP